MNNDPDVSVVIVNWNARHWLSQALTSLHERTSEVSFEVIVVDNGSDDGSVPYIKDAWPDITLVPLDHNHGFAAANNIGFTYCRGSYVLLLNADTICLPTTVSGLVECMEAHPEAGCVGAKHYNPDGSLQWSIDDFPSLLNDTLQYTDLDRIRALRGWLRYKYPRWSAHDSEREVDWVNGACLMVRREVIDRVGDMDEYFFVYADELDWCLRIWRAGWTVRFTPRAEVIHFLGATFSSTDGWRRVLLYQSILRYYKKHYSRGYYTAMRAVLATNAALRLVALSALRVATLAGFSVRSGVWELVTQEPAKMTWTAMYRTWWNIMRVGPNAAIRP